MEEGLEPRHPPTESRSSDLNGGTRYEGYAAKSNPSKRVSARRPAVKVNLFEALAISEPKRQRGSRMGVAPEVIDCERFVRAWKRFRERYPEDQIGDDHRNMLQQYIQTAGFYHHRVLQLHAEENVTDLGGSLSEVLDDAQRLLDAKCPSPAPCTHRLSRPSEYLRRRKQPISSAVSVVVEARPEHGNATGPTHSNPALGDDSTVHTMALSYDDLKSMLETNHSAKESMSTQEIRRRLGLLDRDTINGTSSSDAIAKEEQESIQSDMVNLAKTLKERTQSINQSLVDDVKILDAVGQSAESNAELLDRENAVLKQQLASSIGFWTSLWLVMAAVMVFFATYIYMKLFSRRQW